MDANKLRRIHDEGHSLSYFLGTIYNFMVILSKLFHLILAKRLSLYWSAALNPACSTLVAFPGPWLQTRTDMFKFYWKQNFGEWTKCVFQIWETYYI